MQQVAEELARLLGRSVVYNDRSAAEHRAALLSSDQPQLLVDLLLGLDKFFRESALAEATSTFEKLTGRPPLTLSDWLRENLALFQ